MKQNWRSEAQPDFQRAQVCFRYNASGVVFDIEAEDSAPGNTVRSDNKDAWGSGDLLEVFLQDPEASFYTEWHVTPEGHIWRKRFALDSPEGSRNGQSEWIEALDLLRVESVLVPGGWRARFCIPWAAVSRDGARPSRLRWAVCRYDYPGARIGEAPVLSSTAALGAPDFHRREDWTQTHLAAGESGADFAWSGVDHVVVGPDGLRPMRVSPELLASMTVAEGAVARMTAGIELQIPAAGVRRVALAFRILNDDGFPPSWSLFLDNMKVHPTLSAHSGSCERQMLAWQVPVDAQAGDTLRIIFPTHAEVEVLRVEAAPASSVEVVPYGVGGRRWLVHGDSITHGANVTSPDFTWIRQVGERLGWHPINFGFGGNARAQPYLADAIAARADWEVLSLHIGINSIGESEEVYAVKYADFLDRIRAAHPEKPIFCATPVWHHTDANGDESAAETIRAAIRGVVLARQPRDSHLYLIEGRRLLEGPEGFLVDGVHPYDKGVVALAENLVSEISRLTSGWQSGAPEPAREVM